MLKMCTKCKIEKELIEFSKNPDRKSGYRCDCKECRRLAATKYREKNREKLNEKNRIWIKKVKDPNYIKPLKIKLTEEEKKKRRSEYTTKYTRNRCKKDSLFKLKIIIRNSISRAFKNIKKTSKTESILGMTYIEFRIYIETLFKEGMTWDNYGKWHLDHKIPISWGNTKEEIIKLNHYINFQPLWANENLSKGNRYSN